MQTNFLKAISLVFLVIITHAGIIMGSIYYSLSDECTSVSGRPEGASVGGSFDGIADELINAKIDNSDKKAANRADGQQRQIKGQCPSERRGQNRERDRRDQFTILEIKELTAADLIDDVIMNQICSTRSRYNLSADDIISLKQAKVGDRVIEYMINTSK